jgi:probable F420-dependent oxidoreductase
MREVIVTKLSLGSTGAFVDTDDGGAYLDLAAKLEEAGFGAIWYGGGPLRGLDQLAAAVRATATARIGSAIVSVDRFDRGAVAAFYHQVESEHPGRFVLGLGGAHGPKPFDTLSGYLDELDRVAPTVPADRRVLAALGPRMLGLARDRAAGAFPVVVTPEYTAEARALLGSEPSLVVGQYAVLETDPGLARETARSLLAFMRQGPAYRANWRRMGFTDDDIAQFSDRLVDALLVHGDVDAVAERVSAHHRAGADHVAVGSVTPLPAERWRDLAIALGLP